jgi:ribose transport system permease protein
VIYGMAGGWPVRDLPASFRYLGQDDLIIGPVSFPVPMVIMLIFAVIVAVAMNTTALGRYIYALGGNQQVLTVTGIDAARVKMVVYTLCGALTAIGGILMTARLGVAAPTAAAGYEVDIIAATVIGGTSLFGGEGSILGVLLGAAFMQILRNSLVLLGFPAYWQDGAIGSMIIVALLFDYYRQRRVTR